MKKKMGRRIFSVILAVSLMVTSVICGSFAGHSATAQAATRDEAVAWANAQIGKGLDYDGAYGNQCVDLIKYYYDYFGVAGYATGNANAYITNALPPGWTRVYGDYQPGDVAVWKVNYSCGTYSTTAYGHVGIITSADSVGFNAVNQNFNNQSYCTQNWFNISALACAIRPVYSGNTPAQPATPNISFADFNQNGVWDTNAEMYIKVMNPDKHTVSSVGCYLYNANGNLVKSYSENCGLSTSYVNYNCNLNNDMQMTLTPGTTYYFELYAVVEGQEFKDSKRSFTTTGQAPVEVTPEPATPETPTCQVTLPPQTKAPNNSGSQLPDDTKVSMGDTTSTSRPEQPATETSKPEQPATETSKPGQTESQSTGTPAAQVTNAPAARTAIPSSVKRVDIDNEKVPSKPGKVVIKKVSPLKNGKVKVTWKKVAGADFYAILYSTKKNFKGAGVAMKEGKKATLYLKKKKTYYICVRACVYGNSANNNQIVTGKWSITKKVRTRK